MLERAGGPNEALNAERAMRLAPRLLSIALDVFAAPAAAADQIAARRRLMVFPLVAFIGVFIGYWLSYYAMVDFPWLTERMVQEAMDKDPRASVASVRAAMQSTSAGLMGAIVTVTGTISICIILALRAVYQHVMGQLVGKREVKFAT